MSKQSQRSEYMEGEGYTNSHGIMCHVLEKREKGNSDPNAWRWVDIPYTLTPCWAGLIDKNTDRKIFGALDAKALVLWAKEKAVLANYSTRVLRFPVSQSDADELVAANNWHERESKRLADGTNTPLPWVNEPWFKERCEALHHYPYVSQVKLGTIAFTFSHAQGVADRHEVMSPGRYLQEFYNWEYLDGLVETGVNVKGEPTYTSRLVLLCQQFEAQFGSAHKLHYAHTADEIEDVYTNGPESCMWHEARSYDSSVHPVRVYAAGDLALAYIRDENDDITARALVWPDKKRVGRVYGDCPNLVRLLRLDGYTCNGSQGDWNSLSGARLLKIHEYGDTYVMPFIDGDNSFGEHESGNYFVIGGEYPGGNTNGISSLVPECLCECCGEMVEESETFLVITRRDNELRWCDHCVGNRAFFCSETNTYYDSNFHDCITLDNGSCVHVTYADDYFKCAVMEEYYHIDHLAGPYRDGDGQVSKAGVHCEGLIKKDGAFWPADEIEPDGVEDDSAPRCPDTQDMFDAIPEIKVA